MTNNNISDMSEKLRRSYDSAEPEPPPANLYDAILRAAERYGIVTLAALTAFAVLGYAIREVYFYSNKTNESLYVEMQVHQRELMAYLTNRNDSDAKRAVADLDLAKSLQALSQAIDRQTNIVERIL